MLRAYKQAEETDADFLLAIYEIWQEIPIIYPFYRLYVSQSSVLLVYREFE